MADLTEDIQARLFASLAEEQRKAGATHERDAERYQGARDAFGVAMTASVGSVLSKLDADEKAGKIDEAEAKGGKRWLGLAAQALENAQKNSENNRLHTLGKAHACKVMAEGFDKRQRAAFAAAQAIRLRLTEGESEEAIRRPKPAPGLVEAQARMAPPKPEPPKPTKKRPSRKTGSAAR